MSRKPRAGAPAMAIMEEAFHLVRRSPFSVLALYYIGAIPFVIGLLYFADNMSHRYANDKSCAEAALGLAGLFIWMKCWQTVYARRLLAEAREEGVFPWTFRRICRMVTAQAVLQPLGMIAIPLALLAVIPYAWVYGIFQNITVLGDGEDDRLRTLTSRCSRLAGIWLRQSFICIWILSPALIVFAALFYGGVIPVISASEGEDYAFLLVIPSLFAGLLLVVLCPFGLLVAANVASAVAALPFLLRTLFGVDTVFSMSPSALFNTVFLLMVCGMTYLFLDPLMKAVYVLRCFHGESVTTGGDLRVALRRRRNGVSAGTLAILVAAALLGFGVAAHAAEDSVIPETPAASPAPTVSTDALDKAISTVLEHRDYAWRLPRESASDSEPGLLRRFLTAVRDIIVDGIRAVFRFLRRIEDWLSRHRGERQYDPSKEKSPFQWKFVIEPIAYVALVVLLCIAGIMGWRTWQTREKLRRELAVPAPAAAPDIADEGVLASELPEDGWLALARELAGRGEYRLALRAVFLAALAQLAHKELVRIAKFKSNRDYYCEVARRAHAAPEVQRLFGTMIEQFEQVWYGTREATSAQVALSLAEQERLRLHAP